MTVCEGGGRRGDVGHQSASARAETGYWIARLARYHPPDNPDLTIATPPVGTPLRGAESAKAAGYPERFAQLALGHNSQAVHGAYAKNAQVTLPPLEEYERKTATPAVIPMPLPAVG